MHAETTSADKFLRHTWLVLTYLTSVYRPVIEVQVKN